jgi:hypothetical protein
MSWRESKKAESYANGLSVQQRLVAQIDALLEALQRANSEIGQLRDEIAVLKGEKARPRVQAQQDGRKHRQDGCAKL